MRNLLCAGALVLAGCATPLPDPRDNARSLAAAETAFAAHSMREDMRAAFIANFSETGVFVREGWAPARAWLTPRPAPPIVLDWRPAYVEVAASGEIGLSTGPWKLLPRDNPQAAPAYGQFVSIWKREGAGPWRVAVDLGIFHADPVFWDRTLETALVPGGAAPAGDTIEAAERRFAQDSQSLGARAAYERHGAANLRLYRNSTAPMVGKQAALGYAGLASEPRAWLVEKSETARSNDFGYARGSYSTAPGGPVGGWYLRAWHREAGAWRIAMDVTNPAPPPRPAQ